ncbi:hypothetical protein [Mycobacterium kubicae]|uniref:Uncharacterized protein n=1 Tax=Mycobacterium kubicae TaxID=120959 RepID=A0AAX1J5W2_9MYCO|nr:hypothetical protein [Mycobacterium kubicae]MCV7096149.1 hypothetical protein [Mycobacterium kubicae]QNI07278.1 hypothetical protein GAN17_14010 [Mycobacterium kubicae]QNI12296.1 hypothetical protein GAN18_14710 [Mycobacterium kubicae]QPI35813.1 hypothetical protein I2456_14505 [Mycobacterium kubicae]
MDRSGSHTHRRCVIACGALALIFSVASLPGCTRQNAAPHPAPTSTSKDGVSATNANNAFVDEQQLRELYSELVSAIGRFDIAEQVRLTCNKYQADLQRRADADPMMQIDFFGSPDQVRRLGLEAATDKLQTVLLPASREAVQAVVQSILDGNAAAYKLAIHRVEQEGSTAILDRIDNIAVTGDTATVRGAYTLKLFTRPPEVVDGTNQAIREQGQWRDCTPSRRQQ